MKKNEQDILNIVKEKMENVDVPESIMPEQIEKKIAEMDELKGAGRSNPKKKKFYYYGGLVAACLVLATGVYTIGNYSRINAEVEEAAPEEG